MKKTLLNLTQNRVLSRNVKYCNRIFSRMKGLLGTSRPGEIEACWLVPCNSIHTLGMRYTIDAYFLNKKNEVVAIVKRLKPNRFSPLYLNAHSVLEFPAADGNHCQIGDRLAAEDRP